MKYYNFLYIARQFNLSSDTYATEWGVCFQKEIEKNCNSFYMIDYVDSYLEKGKKGFENYVLNFIDEKKINCVIFSPLSPDATVDPVFLKKIHDVSVLIMLFTDGEYYFERIHRYYAQVSDLVLNIGNYYSKFGFQLLGINTIQFINHWNTELYKGGEPRDPDIDVSFVGNINQANRRQYIKFLEQNGVAPEVYGSGSKNGILPFEKMIDVWHRSKINLHFTSLSYPKGFLVTPPNINLRIKQYKGRILEVPLSGGFLLTEYMPDMEHFLKIGEECDVFYSKEDMLEKIKYYLEHDEEREKIAKKGYERCMSDYNFRSGLKKMFNALQDIQKGNATVYLDDAFLECYASRRFFYLPNFLVKGDLGKMAEELRIILLNIRHLNFKRAFLYFFAGFCENVCGENFKQSVRKLKIYAFIKKIPRY